MCVCENGYLVLYWGAKHTGCVSLIIKSFGGTSGAHTCSERRSWCSCEFLARLQETAQHRHTVPACLLFVHEWYDPCDMVPPVSFK